MNIIKKAIAIFKHIIPRVPKKVEFGDDCSKYMTSEDLDKQIEEALKVDVED